MMSTYRCYSSYENTRRATTSLEAVPDHGTVLGGGHSSGRLLCSLRKLFSPFSHPSGVFSPPGRLSSGSGFAPRGRGEACQRSLGDHTRSGSWLSSRRFLMDLTSACWRPMIILSPTNEFALLTPFPKTPVILCCFLQREGFFSSSIGSGNRVLSDPNTSILM